MEEKIEKMKAIKSINLNDKQKKLLVDNERKLMNEKMFVFIDDSGDPSFKGKASSDFFVMAAVVIKDTDMVKKIDREISNYREYIGWDERYEFKFHKSPRKIKIELLNRICSFEFDIYAVFIDKEQYSSIDSLIEGKKLYNWVIRKLLKIIPLRKATIKIDGQYGEKYKQQFRTYIRKGLNISENKIKRIVVQDSRKNNLIQVADLIAGSINRFLQNNKTDSLDYYSIIKSKVVKLCVLDSDNKK